MKTLSFFRLVLAVGLCLMVGAVGSLVTTPKIPTWYAALAKPAWTPPDAAFPIVWTTLYVLMAVALWRLWQLHRPSPRPAPRHRAVVRPARPQRAVVAGVLRHGGRRRGARGHPRAVARHRRGDLGGRAD